MNTSRPVLRRCVACRELFDRSILWRVIRDHRDGVLLDQGMGRSAYLCRRESCLEEAQRRKRLHKDLRCQVPDSALEELRSRLNSNKPSVAEAR